MRLDKPEISLSCMLCHLIFLSLHAKSCDFPVIFKAKWQIRFTRESYSILPDNSNEIFSYLCLLTKNDTVTFFSGGKVSAKLSSYSSVCKKPCVLLQLSQDRIYISCFWGCPKQHACLVTKTRNNNSWPEFIQSHTLYYKPYKSVCTIKRICVLKSG